MDTYPYGGFRYKVEIDRPGKPAAFQRLPDLTLQLM